MVPVALFLLLTGALAKPPPMDDGLDDGNFTMDGIIEVREENFTMDGIILERSDLDDRAINTCDCAPVTASSRIVGGKEVNKRYVITAAHCTDYQGSTITDVKVAIGEHSICDGVTNEGGSWISAKRVVNHPNYGNHDNDIAVLELSEDITFTANIKPACLPTSATKDYSNLASTISGWGGTIGYSGAQPQQPRQCELKESVVKVLSPTSQKCSSFLGTTTSTSKLCAWAEGTDTCQGDSGGPLTVAENGKFVL